MSDKLTRRACPPCREGATWNTRGRVFSPKSASAEMEIFREVEQVEFVFDRIAAAQREELEQEIAGLQAEEARKLVGDVAY